MKPIILTLLVMSCLLIGNACAEDRELFIVSSNSQPDRLPTLGVWQDYAKSQDSYDTLLSATFPNVPQFTCDLWCYESPGIRFQSARELSEGQVELHHTWDEHGWDIITTATPRFGALEVVATLVPASEESREQPQEYPNLNICWQLRRAKDFASEPEPYPEFVRRCFISTDHGCAFLLDTERQPIPVRESTHKYNNPPWVQIYAPQSAPADLHAKTTDWAEYSPDRYRLPIIGAVSRDRKYLTAIASGAESIVCQAWHDCMHNNPGWLPSTASRGKEWRVMIYAMENDFQALVTRFQEDFPTVEPWKETRTLSKDSP